MQRDRQYLFSLPLHGYEIPVYLVDGLVEDAEADGRWIPSKIEIELDSGMLPTKRPEVLVHELAHAISDFGELELDENQVRVLGLGLHQALKPYLKDLVNALCKPNGSVDCKHPKSP